MKNDTRKARGIGIVNEKSYDRTKMEAVSSLNGNERMVMIYAIMI